MKPDPTDADRSNSKGAGNGGRAHAPLPPSTNVYNALVDVANYLQLEPTTAAYLTQINADPLHDKPYWPMAVEMVAVLTDDTRDQGHVADNHGPAGWPTGRSLPGTG